MQQLSLQQIVANQDSSTTSHTTLVSKVHTMKILNPKDKQQYEGKRKGNWKKGKGGNDKNNYNNVDEGENEKKKVKFPCDLFTDDHLTHHFSRIEEA